MQKSFTDNLYRQKEQVQQKQPQILILDQY